MGFSNSYGVIDALLLHASIDEAPDASRLDRTRWPVFPVPSMNGSFRASSFRGMVRTAAARPGRGGRREQWRSPSGPG